MIKVNKNELEYEGNKIDILVELTEILIVLIKDKILNEEDIKNTIYIAKKHTKEEY